MRVDTRSDFVKNNGFEYDYELLNYPYTLLIYCDGRPDHNMNFVSSQVSLFGLFLVQNIDKIIFIRGFPCLSHLNTSES